MLQHYAHSRNRPTATDEKKRKIFSILVAISLFGTILGKSLKLLPPDVIFFKAKMQKKSISVAYSAPPDPLAEFTGGLLLRGMKGRKGVRGEEVEGEGST